MYQVASTSAFGVAMMMAATMTNRLKYRVNAAQRSMKASAATALMRRRCWRQSEHQRITARQRNTPSVTSIVKA